VFVELVNKKELEISSTSTSSKVVPIVSFHGYSIYKSTLVDQLNGNLYLSKDRITWMKNSIYFNNSDDYLVASSFTTSMLLGLGFDIGV